jgi:hypothetical protein
MGWLYTQGYRSRVMFPGRQRHPMLVHSELLSETHCCEKCIWPHFGYSYRFSVADRCRAPCAASECIDIAATFRRAFVYGRARPSASVRLAQNVRGQFVLGRAWRRPPSRALPGSEAYSLVSLFSAHSMTLQCFSVSFCIAVEKDSRHGGLEATFAMRGPCGPSLIQRITIWGSWTHGPAIPERVSAWGRLRNVEPKDAALRDSAGSDGGENTPHRAGTEHTESVS